MWDWTNKVLLTTIFPVEEDGTLNPWQRDYIADNQTVLIGQPRLRMLRIREGINKCQ